MTRPVLIRWDGEAFVPANTYQARIASQAYEVGQAVAMAPFEDRSRASHNHEFAWLSEAWNSLPECHSCQSWAATPEHLRKYALIRTGFCNSIEVVAGSHAAALRVAAAFRSVDEYAVATVSGQTVTYLTAKSQSTRAMDKRQFQESKTAILEFIAGLIGVEPETLGKQTRAA
jgi:hypothetical protein